MAEEDEPSVRGVCFPTLKVYDAYLPYRIYYVDYWLLFLEPNWRDEKSQVFIQKPKELLRKIFS